MLNVYVHARIVGLPADLIYDDAFADGLFAALPDMGLGADREALTVTLSQFSLSDRRAACRQLERIRHALAALGYQEGVVQLDETVREGWRDDVGVLAGAILWHVRRRAGRL